MNTNNTADSQDDRWTLEWMALRERYERDSNGLSELELDRLAGLELRLALEGPDELLRDAPCALWACLTGDGADVARVLTADATEAAAASSLDSLATPASVAPHVGLENAGTLWVEAKSPDEPLRLKTVIKAAESRGETVVRLRDLLDAVTGEQAGLNFLELTDAYVNVLVLPGITLRINGIPVTSEPGERRKYRRETLEEMMFSAVCQQGGRVVEIRLE